MYKKLYEYHNIRGLQSLILDTGNVNTLVFPNYKNSDYSKLNGAKIIISVSDRVENTMGEAENPGYLGGTRVNEVPSRIAEKILRVYMHPAPYIVRMKGWTAPF